MHPPVPGPSGVRQGQALPENPSKRFELVEKPAKPRPVTGTRRWQRYPLDVPIRVIVDTPGKTKLYEGRGNELSEGGMAVTAGAELSPGREVAIEFTPPYTCIPIRVRGPVRNRTGYRYGVEFLTESPAESDQVNRLRQMLQSLSTVSP